MFGFVIDFLKDYWLCWYFVLFIHSYNTYRRRQEEEYDEKSIQQIIVDAFEYNEEFIQQEQQNRLLICGNVMNEYEYNISLYSLVY